MRMRALTAGAVLAATIASGAAHAATIDLTTLTHVYDPTIWSETVSTNLITIHRIAPSNGGEIHDGPPTVVNGDFVATLDVIFDGTTRGATGFGMDNANGFIGIGIGGGQVFSSTSFSLPECPLPLQTKLQILSHALHVH